MTDNTENKVETLPDLDDLLQCPVCYEIPSGQIFQCNEGHHVCGRCKMRLDVCPVCRAFFFGTRNYAMEELIANVRKLRAFKLGGKVTTGSPPVEVTEVKDSSSEEEESTNENVNDDEEVSSGTSARPPSACKGLFRCLCCKNNPERLPLGRLLNHLRYYHSPDLIEGRSENEGYIQAWQFPTAPGRMVTAVRVHDMGIFFLVLEVTYDSVYAWMSMAASPWIAHEFSYSFTLSGNDREAIFSDCVWSVRSCEGSLKKRGRCLGVTGADARALLTPAAMSGKLSVRRTPRELQPSVTQPRAVLRVANRSNAQDAGDVAHDLEPFLQDLQNDVARLSRAFATLGREANALVRSEAEMRARLENAPGRVLAIEPPDEAEDEPAPRPEQPQPAAENGERQMTRSARRRMRQRLRQAFRVSQASEPSAPAANEANERVARQPPRASTCQSAGARPHDARAAAIPAPNLIENDNVAPRIPLHVRPLVRAQPPVDIPRPGLNQNVISRPQNQVANNAVRVSNIAQPAISVRPMYAPVRPPGHSQNSGMSRDINGPAAAITPRIPQNRDTPAVISELAARGFEVVSGPPLPPPPVPPPTFDGPSRVRPSNGNARNKKKHRQHR